MRREESDEEFDGRFRVAKLPFNMKKDKLFFKMAPKKILAEIEAQEEELINISRMTSIWPGQLHD
jgi:hypothetical protein